MKELTYSINKINESYNNITELLIDKKLTISTMESCTSGLIATLLTNKPGASSILKGAFVTYCNEAKILQGVPEHIIDTFGVYSKETAIAMAKACKEKYNSDIGIGITGTLDRNDPSNPTITHIVYTSIVYNDLDMHNEILYIPDWITNRFQGKLFVADHIATSLLSCILKKTNNIKGEKL